MKDLFDSKTVDLFVNATSHPDQLPECKKEPNIVIKLIMRFLGVK